MDPSVDPPPAAALPTSNNPILSAGSSHNMGLSSELYNISTIIINQSFSDHGSGRQQSSTKKYLIPQNTIARSPWHSWCANKKKVYFITKIKSIGSTFTTKFEKIVFFLKWKRFQQQQQQQQQLEERRCDHFVVQHLALAHEDEFEHPERNDYRHPRIPAGDECDVHSANINPRPAARLHLPRSYHRQDDDSETDGMNSMSLCRIGAPTRADTAALDYPSATASPAYLAAAPDFSAAATSQAAAPDFSAAATAFSAAATDFSIAAPNFSAEAPSLMAAFGISAGDCDAGPAPQLLAHLPAATPAPQLLAHLPAAAPAPQLFAHLPAATWMDWGHDVDVRSGPGGPADIAYNVDEPDRHLDDDNDDSRVLHRPAKRARLHRDGDQDRRWAAPPGPTAVPLLPVLDGAAVPAPAPVPVPALVPVSTGEWPWLRAHDQSMQPVDFLVSLDLDLDFATQATAAFAPLVAAAAAAAHIAAVTAALAAAANAVVWPGLGEPQLGPVAGMLMPWVLDNGDEGYASE